MTFLVYEAWERLKILILELIPEIRVQDSKCEAEDLEDAGTGVRTSGGCGYRCPRLFRALFFCAQETREGFWLFSVWEEGRVWCLL